MLRLETIMVGEGQSGQLRVGLPWRPTRREIERTHNTLRISLSLSLSRTFFEAET